MQPFLFFFCWKKKYKDSPFCCWWFTINYNGIIRRSQQDSSLWYSIQVNYFLIFFKKKTKRKRRVLLVNVYSICWSQFVSLTSHDIYNVCVVRVTLTVPLDVISPMDMIESSWEDVIFCFFSKLKLNKLALGNSSATLDVS